ncbi:MAG: acylneuraminate cytidylyltransferase family protein [Anaerolineaceae bacterium]|jgi:N-acylneuraminate cytidylyltransferase|nr:MAG: acylneuraminate cytidylyltransferase family protein [Anaerolineaceae bacterium]
MKRVLGIIPARGGSKGVPRKNIREVAGKPLIAYSIMAAQSSRLLTRCIVSTDDTETAEISAALGCEVMERPAELAQDDTPTVSVVKHIFERLESEDELFDYGLVLQPTSPLRTGLDIDSALQALFQSDADSIVSVYQVSDHHPARMYKLNNGLLTPLDEKFASARRQELPPIYHRNGAIYAFRRSLLDKDTLLGNRILPYIMEEDRSLNIDTEYDLVLADFVLSRKK